MLEAVAPESPVDTGFAGLGLSITVQATLQKLGYTEPTPIQRVTIPPLVAGRDVLGEAATGTGKTAAFALPLLTRLGPFAPKAPASVLVLVPTRELAMQVAKAFMRYGAGTRAKVVAVYGGAPIGPQIRDLQGAHIVVATPGRALDHMERGTLDLSALQAVVLDEADEMLDMGFSEDLEKILAAAPAERQTALFSATMPKHILGLAARHQQKPLHLRVDRAAQEAQKALVDQLVCFVPQPVKLAALGRLLLAEQPQSALVFCHTREDVDAVTDALNADGFSADAIHGGLSQAQRDAVMARFRGGRSTLLVATDVAARGLDVSGVSHVFNFDLPEAAEVYVHRIGRTGRAGKNGVAISLVAPFQNSRLRRIEAMQRTRVTQVDVPTEAQVKKIALRGLRTDLEAALAEEPSEEALALVAELSLTHGAENVLAAAVALLTKGDGPAANVLKRAADRSFQAPRPPPPKPNRPFKATANAKKGNWVPRHLRKA